MQLKAGTKMASTVCETQVVVVRAPADEVELGCGGAPLVEASEAGEPTGTPDPSLADGTLIGKRYADEELGVELLCTKAGAGTLTCNGAALAIKGAKPLPASD